MAAPDPGSIWGQLIGFVGRNIDLVEPLVFLLGFAESIVLVSLLVPSTILFLAIGGLHNAAGGEFLPLWLAGAAGAFLGDVVSYALGRYFRADIAGIWPFSKKPEWYVMARGFFHTWGAPGIIASPMIGPSASAISSGDSWMASLITQLKTGASRAAMPSASASWARTCRACRSP